MAPLQSQGCSSKVVQYGLFGSRGDLKSWECSFSPAHRLRLAVTVLFLDGLGNPKSCAHAIPQPKWLE